MLGFRRISIEALCKIFLPKLSAAMMNSVLQPTVPLRTRGASNVSGSTYAAAWKKPPRDLNRAASTHPKQSNRLGSQA